jgi:four helix bundle protein
MELVERIYAMTARFPTHEQYGLTGQLRRAAVSIPCNISEGAARHTRKEFINFLHIAQGSLSELDTLSDIALRLKYIGSQEHAALDLIMERLDKTLSGLIRQQRNLIDKACGVRGDA